MRSLLRRRAGRPSPAVPPAPPDLLAESKARSRAAGGPLCGFYGTSPLESGDDGMLYGLLDGAPDPYGPDRVVFGTVPRVENAPEVMG